MILRISQELGRKIKTCPSQILPLDPNPYADWSCRLFTESRTQYIMITNTVSLYTMVMLGKGITDNRTLIDRATNHIADFVCDDGFTLIFERHIMPSMAQVSFSKALNRSVTGSMNDLELISKWRLRNGEMSLCDISSQLNDTLFSYIKMKRPRAVFQSMISE